MKAIFALLAFLSVVRAISQGTPPQCNVYLGGLPVNFGCNTFGIKNGVPNSRLNCTEPSPGIMPWALRPVAGVGKYTLRAGDGTPSADRTTYTPGRLMPLYLRVLDYNYKFRGLLGYARPVNDNNSRVGTFEPADTTLYNSPWPQGNQCQGALTHASARIKPYLSVLWWRAPPAGTGAVKFEFLIKQGDANTGAFFYPATQLVLNEGPAGTPQTSFSGASGKTCTQICSESGATCDDTAQQALATGGLTAFQTAMTPWFTCDHFMAACKISDPIRQPGVNDCTYFDATTCPGGTSPASTCSAIAEAGAERLCACKPDPCNPSPCCSTGGTCSVNTAVPLSESAWTCTCNSGFAGVDCCTLAPTCGNGVNPQYPCLNGGTCRTPTGGQTAVSCDCSSSFGGAWTGNTCEIPPPCNSNPCNSVDTGATCLNFDQGGRNFTARCQCSAGYSGPQCTVIDGCVLRNLASQSCMNGGICVDNPNDAATQQSSCNCPLGFIGQRCEIDLDECAFGQNPCAHGTCTNLVGTFSCTCDPTWSGPLCDKPSVVPWCTPVSPCVNALACYECPSSVQCTAADIPANYSTSYKCQCRPGYGGKQCDQITDYCATTPCANGGTCTNNANPSTGTCTCPTGYTGTRCELDVNECTNNPCVNGVCLNLPGTFNCTCNTGFTGPLCDQAVTGTVTWCTPTSPCINSNGCHECPTDAACTSADIPAGQTTSYKCDCLAGFTGKQCQTSLAGFCGSNPCANGATCTNDAFNPSIGTCTCAAGFTGTLCDVDVNECLNANQCSGHGVCTNLVGGFSCLCDLGYTGQTCSIGSADWCQPFNPCINSNACYECPANALCTSADIPAGQTSSYHCDCKFGYSGKQCQTLTNFCAVNPCQNGGVCSVNLLQSPTTGYVCTCPTGYTGTHCETNIDDCTAVSGTPCANGGTCVDGVNTYTCSCASGYSGASCTGVVLAATAVACVTDDDCPSSVSSVCEGVGQLAACSIIIGCQTDSDCPSQYTCTGSDIPNSDQLYCVQSVQPSAAGITTVF